MAYGLTAMRCAGSVAGISQYVAPLEVRLAARTAAVCPPVNIMIRFRRKYECGGGNDDCAPSSILEHFIQPVEGALRSLVCVWAKTLRANWYQAECQLSALGSRIWLAAAMHSPISAPPLAACPAARNHWASNSGSLKTTATGAYWSPKISNSCWQRDPRSLPCTHTGVPDATICLDS